MVERVEVARNRYDASGAFQASKDTAEALVLLAGTASHPGEPFVNWWASHPRYHRPR